tara:strand:+ start:437 stop:622 length:186 start_codon:yes stop_codon:yes gene_type:complete
MNIFYLHPNAQVCAEMHCDKKAVDTVQAYREYYCGEKMYMAKWSYSERPKWANSNHEGSVI